MGLYSMFDSNKEVIRKVSDYMSSKGFVFKKINLSDSSPYAILQNGTSLGYRPGKNKWNKHGFVFFCSKDGKDMNLLQTELGIRPDDNSTDGSRPYAMFIPNGKLEKAIDILGKNPDLFYSSSLNDLNNYKLNNNHEKITKKSSYKEKYYEDYYDFVKNALYNDGYSSSDGSVKTAVSDTFYLERQIKSVDFLTWFENDDSFERAKQEIVDLLVKANRKSSNLDLDIKYYTRDLEYFRRFLYERGYIQFEDSQYIYIRAIDKEKKVDLVKEKASDRELVRKRYKTFNENVFNQLIDLKVKGLPEIVSIKKEGKELVTYEEYISGKNLLQIKEEKGLFREDEIVEITLKLCSILSRLHNLNPPLIHRDIKPSNIMMRSNGDIVLIDFNASKEYQEGNNQDTVLYGTQYFAAPEQFGFGQSSNRTDIFSIAATMSFLMTDMPANQFLAPGKLYPVWEKCLKMEPKDRYSSVDELAMDIVRIWKD